MIALNRPPFPTALLLLLGWTVALPAMDCHLDLYGGGLAGSADTVPADRRWEMGILSDWKLDLLPCSIVANGFYNQGEGDLDQGGTLRLTSREIQLGVGKAAGGQNGGNVAIAHVQYVAVDQRFVHLNRHLVGNHGAAVLTSVTFTESRAPVDP